MSDEKRIERVENAIITLNREMGLVLGELKWIRWLLMAVLGAVIGSIIL